MRPMELGRQGQDAKGETLSAQPETPHQGAVTPPSCRNVASSSGWSSVLRRPPSPPCLPLCSAGCLLLTVLPTSGLCLLLSSILADSVYF